MAAHDRTPPALVLLAMCLLLSTSTTTTACAVTDVDILNFALNLEYLEAQFYSCAAFGHGLSKADRGNGPAPKGCKKAKLSAKGQAYASEIAIHEIAHVRFLREALGKAAVKSPQIDIGPAFSAAANAALGLTLKPAFSPYSEDLTFYHGAFIFEDVGATAYKGAARLLTNKDYLEAAAGILATESYHAGIIRTLLVQNREVKVQPYGVTVWTIVKAISDLRDKLDGSMDMDQGVFRNINNTIKTFPFIKTEETKFIPNIVTVPTDSNAIVYSRSVDQVLKIVYGGGDKKGLFFPKGLNGNIK